VARLRTGTALLRTAPVVLLGLALALGLALVLALAGCGFHPAGSRPLPPVLARPYVSEKDPYTDFAREFEPRLKSAGAEIALVRADSTATIEIMRDTIEQRTLAVSARNIPTDYELVYTVTFAVHGVDQELLAPQTVTLSRDFSFQENELLAKQHEADVLRAQMARDLVAIVMRRLARL
jgi:LPS-assembly lipoprotein